MNAETVVAIVSAALGTGVCVGVPVGAGLVKMYGKVVALGVEMGHVKQQLNGHLAFHERMSESFINKMKEESEFEEHND